MYLFLSPLHVGISPLHVGAFLLPVDLLTVTVDLFRKFDACSVINDCRTIYCKTSLIVFNTKKS